LRRYSRPVILTSGEKDMLEAMTLDEKLAISNRAFELLDTGDREGFSLLYE